MSFPKYPKYKASGVDWLGEVPEGWEVSRIKWLGKTVTGGTPKTEEPAYWLDGDVPWLPSGKVQNNTINKEDADTFITKRALAESAAKLIQPGAALIALTGATCANAAYLTFESTANQSVVGIEPQSNSSGRFIYFSLLSQREQVLTHKSGGAQGGINQEDVRNLVITAPPLAEQAIIAAFLDRETTKIDELVAEQKRLMELLKEKRQAVISHAVTKGLDPHAKMKPSGVEWLGDVPEHWEIVRIKRVATIRYGIGEPPKYHDNGTPLIRATNIHAGKLFAEGMVFVDPTEIPEQRIVWLAAGDIIVVRSGAYTGDSAIIPDGFGPCIAGFDMVLKCHTARPEFVQFALLSKYLKEGQLDLEKMRAAQPHLNAEELGSCILAMPNSKEQDAITKFLKSKSAEFDTLTAEAQRAIDLLQERRTALISAAVTGQIDVRNINTKETA